MKTVKQVVLEFSALVMVDLFREAEPENEVVKEPVSGSLGGLVRGGIGLGKAGVMIHYY